jgi:outer membrane protein OmpA-like peptidoglycan-associated protein
MRSVITEISSKLFGLSILVFILALLIPLLRLSPSPLEKSGTMVHEMPNSLKKTNEELKLEHTQSPAIDDGLQPSITPLQGEAAQNQSNGLTESTQPAGDSGSPSPDAEEKQSSQHEPITLLVLGGSFFSPGQVTPGAGIQEAIDNIIPLIKSRPLDNIVIEGHADKWVPDGANSVQISKLNKNISLWRANAIALVLKQKEIASDRIIVHSLGDTVPLASNLTYEGRSKNRRVEIKLLPAQ